MLIRCWGSRGSVPVSGRDYIKYGGDTTCVEVVSASGDIIILDAGTGIRLLGNRLSNNGTRKMNLLLTHAHWDHLFGFPFFKPIYSKESAIKIYGPQPTQDSLKRIISKTMTAPNFPIEFDDIKADISFLGMGFNGYSIGSVKVSTVPLSHPNMGVGYRLEEDGKAFVFLTDNELTFRHPFGLGYEGYREFCKGADLLFHDAEYRKEEYESGTRGWGHSTYQDAVRLAMDAGVRTLGLFHQNQDRTDGQVDGIVEECRNVIRKDGSGTECLAVAAGTEIEI